MVEGFIPEETYRKIITLIPLLCVDIVIRDSSGKYLLVQRSNEPYSKEWWVVGGRVEKGEKLTEAAVRKVKEETGLTVHSLIPVGYYEDFYSQNAFGTDGIYHTMSVVFTAEVDTFTDIRLDEQSSDWKQADRLPGNFVIQCFEQMTAFPPRIE